MHNSIIYNLKRSPQTSHSPMNQRETMFTENLIGKAFPGKHHLKKSVSNITETTGIDFKKGQERSFSRQRSSYGDRNPITGENVAFVPYRRCQQSGPKFAGQSFEIPSTGITESKKHVVKNDNIKANRVSTIDVSWMKYRDQEKQGRVNTYMNSSQVKGIFSMEDDKYYRGIVSRK